MDNKQIIGYCNNFYKIINFEPMEIDVIFEKLVKLYQNYIFKIDINSAEDIKTIKELDHVLGQYIDDYLFRQEFKKEIVKVRIEKGTKDILKEFISSIINIFYKYEEHTTRVVYVSKWI